MLKTLPIGAFVLVPSLVAASLLAGCGGALAASAVQKECSAKYQAAKAANSLNGQTYRQYYKQCSTEAKAEKGAAPAAPASTPVPAPVSALASPPPAAPKAIAPTTTAAAPAAPAPVAPTRRAPAPSAPAVAGSAVFPTAVSAEFSNETPGKARFHTCLAQYHANKASNGNGGLVWLAKGGYYSQCNTRLKG